MCHTCNKIGYLSRKCRSGPDIKFHKSVKCITADEEDASTEIGVYTLYTCNADQISVIVELCGKPIVMQIDTGSAKSLSPELCSRNIWMSNMKIK